MGSFVGLAVLISALLMLRKLYFKTDISLVGMVSPDMEENFFSTR